MPPSRVRSPLSIDDHHRLAALWARSGAAGLCGRQDGPSLGVRAALIGVVSELSTAIAQRSERLGQRVDLDTLALLGERAAFAGLRRNGDVSCGGATQLLQTATGTIALSLARASDIELLPAWLMSSALPGDLTATDDIWDAVSRSVLSADASELVERAILLGLACSRLGEVGTDDPLLTATGLGPRDRHRAKSASDCVVVDLSSLWAGPLCANILALAGMRIIKVESVDRPDGARLGPSGFYDLLHGGHESVALDFTDTDDQRVLRQLVGRADIVIEASRPRALQQLGVNRTGPFEPNGSMTLRMGTGPAVWLSITGHGLRSPNADRVAFGDDAAVAGGLVTNDADGVCFCVDAIADPLTGMLAAATALDALHCDKRMLYDLSLARTAAWCRGGQIIDVDDDDRCAPPLHRTVLRPAAILGADTATVFDSLGIHR